MPERIDRNVTERRAKATAEQVFQLVPGYAKRIAHARTDMERQGYIKQIADELKRVRPFVMGETKGLSEAAASRMRGEFCVSAMHLQQAILSAEVEEAPTTDRLDQLKQAFMPIPPNKVVELGPHQVKKIGQLQDWDERFGLHMDSAWIVFLFDAGIKRLTIPTFNSDEWYGEVMSQRSALMKKLVLPIVAIDQVEMAAREASRPMPRSDMVEEAAHRAQNALEELVEIWEPVLPAIADTYTLVAKVLDQEVATLSLYYRYHEDEK